VGRAFARSSPPAISTHLRALECSRKFRAGQSNRGRGGPRHWETLDKPQRVEELARMLGGAEVSDRFRRAARELLERAQ
jgi:DNA repair ATPase RecN